MRKLLLIILFFTIKSVKAQPQMRLLLKHKTQSSVPFLNQYAGAAAAYSLIKLDSTYSGYAIQVRRSSDNAIQNIGFSGNELDTASLITFCGSNSCFVDSLYDQSGNGLHAYQTINANQPIIDSLGTILRIGSEPCISFNSANAQFFHTPNIINGTTARSIFSVQKPYTAPAPGTPVNTIYALEDTITATNGTAYEFNLEQSNLYIRVQGNANWTYPSSALSYSLISSVFNSGDVSTIKNFFNNIPMALHGSGGLTTLNTENRNGLIAKSWDGPYYLNGAIQFLVFYTSDKTSSLLGMQETINSLYSIY